MPEKLLNRVDGVEEEYQDHTEWDKAKIRQQVTEAVESKRSDASVCWWPFTLLFPVLCLLKYSTADKKGVLDRGHSFSTTRL